MSPEGNSIDLTADEAALFKVTEKDAQGGARWSSRTRPSVIIPTTMARNKGFKTLKDVSRQTSSGGAVAHTSATKAAVNPAVTEKISQIKGTAARRKSSTNVDHVGGHGIGLGA